MKNSARGKAKGRSRTTVFLSEIIDFNLDLASIMSGIAKGDIIRQAVEEHLKKKFGLSPEAKAKITVNY